MTDIVKSIGKDVAEFTKEFTEIYIKNLVTESLTNMLSKITGGKKKKKTDDTKEEKSDTSIVASGIALVGQHRGYSPAREWKTYYDFGGYAIRSNGNSNISRCVKRYSEQRNVISIKAIKSNKNLVSFPSKSPFSTQDSKFFRERMDGLIKYWKSVNIQNDICSDKEFLKSFDLLIDVKAEERKKIFFQTLKAMSKEKNIDWMYVLERAQRLGVDNNMREMLKVILIAYLAPSTESKIRSKINESKMPEIVRSMLIRQAYSSLNKNINIALDAAWLGLEKGFNEATKNLQNLLNSQSDKIAQVLQKIVEPVLELVKKKGGKTKSSKKQNDQENNDDTDMNVDNENQNNVNPVDNEENIENNENIDNIENNENNQDENQVENNNENNENVENNQNRENDENNNENTEPTDNTNENNENTENTNTTEVVEDIKTEEQSNNNVDTEEPVNEEKEEKIDENVKKPKKNKETVNIDRFPAIKQMYSDLQQDNVKLSEIVKNVRRSCDHLRYTWTYIKYIRYPLSDYGELTRFIPGVRSMFYQHERLTTCMLEISRALSSGLCKAFVPLVEYLDKIMSGEADFEKNSFDSNMKKVVGSAGRSLSFTYYNIVPYINRASWYCGYKTTTSIIKWAQDTINGCANIFGTIYKELKPENKDEILPQLIKVLNKDLKDFIIDRCLTLTKLIRKETNRMLSQFFSDSLNNDLDSMVNKLEDLFSKLPPPINKIPLKQLLNIIFEMLIKKTVEVILEKIAEPSEKMFLNPDVNNKEENKLKDVNEEEMKKYKIDLTVKSESDDITTLDISNESKEGDQPSTSGDNNN